jgi:glycosyltransferase involved in cell wall biosynthesis
MLDNKVWIIIPAYNEQNNIAKVIKELLTKTANIIVVNDASVDETAKIMETLPVVAVHHTINRGQGAALQTGTELALQKGAEIIVHFDADGQMQVEDIEKVIEPIINQQAEIVFGSRFLDANSQIPWTKKYLILKPAIIFNWFFTGIKLSDVHNGFRALSGKAASLIEINLDGMAHATEILDQVRIYKLPYAEVPVKIIYHEYGQRFTKGFKIIRDLIFARLIKSKN